MTFQPPRLPDWEARLAALVNANRLRPYIYGTFDCAVFARMAVEAVTGVKLLPDAELPRGWIAAAKFMIARGWDDVEAMATELLGEAVDPDGSRRGDIVSYEEFGEFHLAVRVGEEAVTPSDKGLKIIVRTQWRRAWLSGV